MDPLRLALTAFPALVASAAPSRIDRLLREIAAALAALVSPEETDGREQDDAVHLLLETFCRAHAEDHMSDHTKLGSWRLPYVAMVHSHAALHVPLMRQLEALLLSPGASLGPAQCSALTTFMVFMSPYQIMRKEVDAGLDMDTTSEDVKRVGNSHVKVLFTWRWEACVRAQDGRPDHWMEQFWDAFRMDCEASVLWATRFAASYLRNVAVYWELVLFHRDLLRSDSALQELPSLTLVGPIFVAFVPRKLVLFLLWLQQRVEFACQFAEAPESLKKALALCEAVLSSSLGVLLRSTEVAVSMSKFFELELRAGWKEWVMSKSRHMFLRHVVWSLLWKEFGGDNARACVALTAVFLTSAFKESRALERRLLDARNDDEDEPKSSWTGTKKQCIRAESTDLENLPLFLWLQESEASPAEVCILQIIAELASKLSSDSGPWLLEAAFDCLSSQARLENAIFTHCEACAFAHKCKSRRYSSGICSAHRAKSCIAAVPPSHIISYERLHKMEKVFTFCWLGDGPFSIEFAAQLLSHFHTSQTTGEFLKAESRWSTLLLAAWVRYFDVIAASVLSLHSSVGGIILGSILSHLHTTQKFLTSNSVHDGPNMDEFKAAASAMPQLAALTLIESLFINANSPSREGFLAKLATEASPQQRELARRVEDILRRITDDSEDGAQSFLNSLLFNLVDLASMAVIARPELVAQKWTAFEYKRQWVHQYKSSRENGVSTQERPKPSLLSLASIDLEFDERMGKPQRRTWDILLDWAISLVTLYPYSISQILHGEVAGPKAFTSAVVVAGLPRDTVVSLAQSSATKASWAILLAQMRMGLESGVRRLFLVDREIVACELSVVKTEMDLYLLQLQDIV